MKLYSSLLLIRKNLHWIRQQPQVLKKKKGGDATFKANLVQRSFSSSEIGEELGVEFDFDFDSFSCG